MVLEKVKSNSSIKHDHYNMNRERENRRVFTMEQIQLWVNCKYIYIYFYSQTSDSMNHFFRSRSNWQSNDEVWIRLYLYTNQSWNILMLYRSLVHSFTFLSMIDDIHLSYEFFFSSFFSKFTNVHLYLLSCKRVFAT